METSHNVTLWSVKKCPDWVTKNRVLLKRRKKMKISKIHQNNLIFSTENLLRTGHSELTWILFTFKGTNSSVRLTTVDGAHGTKKHMNEKQSTEMQAWRRPIMRSNYPTSEICRQVSGIYSLPENIKSILTPDLTEHQ